MSDLEQYRQEIDELDEQLVRLFLRRMEVTGKVGEYKLAHGMQVLDRERERRVLAKRASLAVDIRQEEDVKELFQTIMAISRRRQQELLDRSGTGTVRKTNVVLIGMPGSGKSCVGAALAERLGMPLVETDAMVVEKTGRSIPDIFAQDGEAAFRREETAAARRAAAMEGTVISTGGGIILRPENMEILSATGTVYFLDRDPRDIANTELDGRPLLSGGRDRVFLLYDQRINLYRKYARYTVPSTTVDETVDSVLALVRRGQDVR